MKGGEAMVQNSAVNADFQVPVLIGSFSGKAARELSSSDHTFMDMLSERITARSNRNVPVQKTGPVVVKGSASTGNGSEIRATERRNSYDTKVSDRKTKKTGNPGAAKEVQKTSAEEPRPKEEIEEEINALEAMIALLEELMARLEYLSKIAGQDKADIRLEAIPAGKAEGVSLTELLMAVATGNIEKLKEMADELGDGVINDPEVMELIDKIRSLIEKLSGSENKEALLDFTAELEKAGELEPAEAMEELRAKCGQLIQKLRDQVSSLRDTLPKDQENSTADPVMTAETVEETGKTAETEEKEPEKRTDSGERKEKTNKVGHEHQPWTLEEKNRMKGTDMPAIPDNQTAAAPAEEIRQAERMPAVLSRKSLEQTVTSQVTMKIRLMAGENRQEMEINLKPDSLGKLSLKIVHERGEILARITAENEQVKQILESNMQLLRDALEKNGFSVQSLSVSVGNSPGENRTKEETEQRSRMITGTESHSGITVSAKEMADLRDRIEKEYYGQFSRINLTA